MFYHHILDPKTGFPSRRTPREPPWWRAIRSMRRATRPLLALGIERGIAFARERDAILGAYFVDRDGKVAGIA
ncbi:MAG: hypothetical protein ACLSVD_07045 [Eggerthellaceae bacterium]